MQCNAGNPWVLVFKWMPPDMHHTLRQRPQNIQDPNPIEHVQGMILSKIDQQKPDLPIHRTLTIWPDILVSDTAGHIYRCPRDRKNSLSHSFKSSLP